MPKQDENLNAIITSTNTYYYTLEVYHASTTEACNFLGNNLPSRNAGESSLDDIKGYITNEWDVDPIPFNRYSEWSTFLPDMTRLSEEFKNHVFVLYAKSGTFSDKIWVKVFYDGDIISSSSKVETAIRLRMPDGTYKYIDETSDQLATDSEYTLTLSSGDRDMALAAELLTDAGIAIGSVAADLGGYVSQSAIVFKLLGVGVQVVAEMQENLIVYGANKRRCSSLIDRCNNILTDLQIISPHNLNVGSVVCLIKNIQSARNFINKYFKQWKVTKFFSSKPNRRKFTEINDNITDSIQDLQFSYDVKLQKELELRHTFVENNNEVYENEI